jgi:DNA-binding NarL/FixJ family response regulator
MRNILIVEDVAETRNWLAEIAGEAFPGCTIRCAGSVRSALAEVRRGEADVALIDLGLPDGSGIEVLREMRQVKPDALCVITTVMGDDANIVAALSVGANGYLLKEQPAERISRQLSQLAEGIPALSPSIAQRLIEHFRHTGPAANGDGELTAREKEVLAFISRGLRNVDVAKQLGMAEATVATHLKSVYRKLGISSRAEAAWHATRMGLTPG